jgi:hypothetical protein
MTSPRSSKRYKCRFCGFILNAWLPVFQQPNGAMLLQHLLESHRAESRPSVARMRTHEDIGPIAAEACEVIEAEGEG